MFKWLLGGFILGKISRQEDDESPVVIKQAGGMGDVPKYVRNTHYTGDLVYKSGPMDSYIGTKGGGQGL